MPFRYIALLLLLTLTFSCTTTEETSYSDVNPTIPVDQFKTYTWITSDTHITKYPLYDNDIAGEYIKKYADEQLSHRGLNLVSKNADAFFRYTVIPERKSETTSTPFFSNGGSSASTPNTISSNASSQNAYANTYPNVPMTNYVPPAYGGFLPTNNGAPANLYYNNPNSPYNTTYYINSYPNNGGNGFPIGTGAPNGYGIPNLGTPYTIAGTVQQQTDFVEVTLIIDLIDRNTQKLVWRGWTVNKYADPIAFGEDLETQVRSVFEKYPK